MSRRNAEIIRRTLKAEGFGNIAIAGALGRLRAESSLNPNAIRKNDAGPGKHSYGLMQWNRERFQGLKRFAAKIGRDWNDVETQARYFAAEVKGLNGEGKWGSKLLAAKTPRQAAEAAISLARPRGWKANNPSAGHGFQKQLKWTNEFATGGGMDGLGSNDAVTTVAQIRTDPWMGTNNPAHKGRGKMDEEGEAFTADAPLHGIKQLDALSELLFTAQQQEGDQFANPSTGTDGLDVPPIDDSPGTVAAQTAIGFLGLLGQIGAGIKDDGAEFRLRDKIMGGPTKEAGGINRIQGILGGMKAGG